MFKVAIRRNYEKYEMLSSKSNPLNYMAANGSKNPKIYF